MKRKTKNMEKKISLIIGDITKVEADAIVNAANPNLLGGAGVDDAIHAAAGPELYEECLTLMRCPAGEARITKGYKLPAKFVIHTVGPMWFDNGSPEEKDKLLASCYTNSLALAESKGLTSVAFPSISTGAFKFPIERAANVALSAVNVFLQKSKTVSQVIFVLFTQHDFDVYKKIHDSLASNKK